MFFLLLLLLLLMLCCYCVVMLLLSFLSMFGCVEEEEDIEKKGVWGGGRGEVHPPPPQQKEAEEKWLNTFHVGSCFNFSWRFCISCCCCCCHLFLSLSFFSSCLWLFSVFVGGFTTTCLLALHKLILFLCLVFVFVAFCHSLTWVWSLCWLYCFHQNSPKRLELQSRPLLSKIQKEVLALALNFMAKWLEGAEEWQYARDRKMKEWGVTICERERERQRERESNDRDGERDAARKEKRNTNKNQPPRKNCVDQKLGDRIPKQLWRQRRRESAKRDNKTVKAKGPPTKKHLRVLIPIKQTLA